MMETKKLVVPNALLLGEVSRLIEEGHEVSIATKGCSMYPFIRGSVDCVRLKKVETPQVGDIVLAEIEPGHYVLHRILSFGADSITLKGDGNLDRTETCRAENLKGVATAIIAPDGRETDTTTPKFVRRSRRWRSAPRIVRRVFLAIYRRVI